MGTQQISRGDFSIGLLQGPASEPLTLQQAKEHLRLPVDMTDFDNKLNLFIPAARAYLENGWGIRCVTQKVEVAYQAFPAEDRFRLPIWPVQSCDYFTFEDTLGNVNPLVVGATGDAGVQVLTRLNRKPCELVLPWAHVWPPTVLTTADPIRIGLTVGYMTAGQSPLTLPIDVNILNAMCLLISWWWDNGAAATLGSLMKSDVSAIGVDQMMASVKLYY